MSRGGVGAGGGGGGGAAAPIATGEGDADGGAVAAAAGGTVFSSGDNVTRMVAGCVLWTLTVVAYV